LQANGTILIVAEPRGSNFFIYFFFCY